MPYLLTENITYYFIRILAIAFPLLVVSPEGLLALVVCPEGLLAL